MLQHPTRHSQLCTLIKVHKLLDPPKTRPLCSNSGSLLHLVSKVIDSYLQPLLHKFPSYCSNSTQAVQRFTKTMEDLKSKTNDATRYYLVTADAASMCANMIIEEILDRARKLLNEPFMNINDNFPKEELLEAIELILANNAFQYGDAYWLQQIGAAMGNPAAYILAAFYFTHQELFQLLPIFSKWMMDCMRYLDDCLLIWAIDSKDPTALNAFHLFQTVMNALSNLE